MSTVSQVGGPTASAAPTAALIELRGVSVRFGGIVAVDDVSISARSGEVMGLIGPNGAGKTTLFDVMSGVRSPSRGRVVLDGADVTGWSMTRRARAGVRRTFQAVQVFGWLSVADNVLAALDAEGGGGGLLADLVWASSRRSRERARRERVEEVLEEFGLAAIRDEPVSGLPIGLARMVEFARAVIVEPRLLLLDEPTSGLDAEQQAALGGHVDRMRERCAVILVEHDVEFVVRHSDRVVALDLGSVLAEGTPAEVRNHPAVRAAYLGEG